jgi:hypothetical protein
MNDDDFPEGEIDEKTVTVIDALHDVRQLSFEYDFGDSWEHEILMEEQSWSTFGLKFAVCLDGAHACPPEDVGGPGAMPSSSRPLRIPATKSMRTFSSGPVGPSIRLSSISPR